MPRKTLFACTVMLSLLALAAPILAQTTQPSAVEADRAKPELRQAPEPPRSGGAAPATDANGKAAGSDANQQGGGGGGGIFGGQSWPILLLLGAVVLMLVLSSRTRRKQEKTRANMIASMKKGDRVTTIGGVIGTLIEVRDNDVVIKVDEQNNTRLRFLRSAVHHVGEPPAAKDQQQPQK